MSTFDQWCYALKAARGGLALLLLCGLLITACVPKSPDDFQQEDALYAFAMQEAEAGHHEDALKFLNAFKSRYPLSKRTADVQLTIADLYFKRGEYIEAVEAYDLFIELYPSHPKVRYAVLQAGKAHMQQVPGTVDRDQSNVYKAAAKFQQIKQDPTYGEEARKLYDKTQRLLADRDRYVVDYYLKHKIWHAAEVRLRRLVNSYNIAEYRDSALVDLIQVYLHQGKRPEAERHLDLLEQLSDDEKLKVKARLLMAEAKPAN